MFCFSHKLTGFLAILCFLSASHLQSVETVNSESAPINVKLSDEAVKILSSDKTTVADKSEIANAIQSSPAFYNPWALLALGLYKMRQNHFDDAALFLRAAVFRLLVDLKINQDPSLNYVAELAFEQIRDTTRKYVNTPEKKKAWDKALVTASHDLENWDRKTPRDYDERWITLHKVGGSPRQPIKKMSADQKKAIIEEEYRIFRENEPIN